MDLAKEEIELRAKMEKDLRDKREEEELYVRMKRNLADFEAREQKRIKRRVELITGNKDGEDGRNEKISAIFDDKEEVREKERAARLERIRMMFHIDATQKIDYGSSVSSEE